MFSPYEYTWVSAGKGAVQVGVFVLVFLGVVGLVKATYPDRPAYPREFEGGLERELGGAGAVRVCGPHDQGLHRAAANLSQARAPGDPEP